MLLGGSLKFFNFPKSPYLHAKTTPMQDKSPYGDWPGRLIVLAVTAMLIFVQFSDWFQHPNQLTDLWGDAIKNYTAPWYHVKYDSSYAQYQGMHYPFGDHINTVDGQPILSNSLKAVTHYLPGAGEYFPALSNLSMLLSFLIGSFFMYLLYRAFGLPVWLSVVLSVFVTFLSPQTLRVVSHFGLAHIAAIPVCLYLLYRFWKEPTWGKSLADCRSCYMLFLISPLFSGHPGWADRGNAPGAVLAKGECAKHADFLQANGYSIGITSCLATGLDRADRRHSGSQRLSLRLFRLPSLPGRNIHLSHDALFPVVRTLPDRHSGYGF
jgi:hypothetical protein